MCTCMHAAVCSVKSTFDFESGSVLLKSGGASPAYGRRMTLISSMPCAGQCKGRYIGCGVTLGHTLSQVADLEHYIQILFDNF